MGGFETLVFIGKILLYSASILLLIYNFIKFLLEIRRYRRKIRGTFSKVKDYFNEEIVMIRWYLLIPLVLILGLLISSYFPTKEDIDLKPKIGVTEFLHNGKNYRGGITIPDVNKSVTLICDVPMFLNITKMFPVGDAIPTQKGFKIIWSEQKTIQLEGEVIQDFVYPFHVKANFKPSTAKKGEKITFNLDIVKLSEINNNFNEFLDLNFYCSKCSITAKDDFWIKFIESSTYSFYSWFDLDTKEINSFKFHISSEEEVRPFIEIMYYSNGIVNCTTENMPITYDSRINYYSKIDALNISS